MKPSMLTTQMKSISVATYGNQRPIALSAAPARRPASARSRRPLAERLAPAGLALRAADAHQHDAEHDRADRAEHQVGDGLVDREVERADVDRDPLAAAPTRRGIELLFLAGRPPASASDGSASQSASASAESARFTGSRPRSAEVERPARRRARACRRARRAARPRARARASVAASATIATITAIARKVIPKPITPAAREVTRARAEVASVATRARCDAAHSTAPIAQPRSGQPAATKTRQREQDHGRAGGERQPDGSASASASVKRPAHQSYACP